MTFAPTTLYSSELVPTIRVLLNSCDAEALPAAEELARRAGACVYDIQAVLEVLRDEDGEVLA
jgi:hypothetical protein